MSKNDNYQEALDSLDGAVNLRSEHLTGNMRDLHQYIQLVFLEAIARAVLSVAEAIREDKEKEIYCPSCFHRVK